MSEEYVLIDRDSLSQIKSDGREARDGVNRLTAVLGEQNVPQRLSELQARMDTQHAQLRADLVNAIDRTRTEAKDADGALSKRIEEVGAGLSAGLTKLTDRVVPLENDLERRNGGAIAFRLVKDWGAWVFGAGAAMVAYVTSKGHIP